MNSVVVENRNRRSLEDIIAEQEKERGLPILKLEKDIFLKRIKDGGWSGDFLAQAFLSAYLGDEFKLSLGRIRQLDAQGFRIFHQILHIKYIEGWTEKEYFDIASSIKDINEGRA